MSVLNKHSFIFISSLVWKTNRKRTPENLRQKSTSTLSIVWKYKNMLMLVAFEWFCSSVFWHECFICFKSKKEARHAKIVSLFFYDFYIVMFNSGLKILLCRTLKFFANASLTTVSLEFCDLLLRLWLHQWKWHFWLFSLWFIYFAVGTKPVKVTGTWLGEGFGFQ